MAFFKILALLIQFAGSPLGLKIESCIATQTGVQNIVNCILSSIAGANLQPGTEDHAAAEHIKALAAKMTP